MFTHLCRHTVSLSSLSLFSSILAHITLGNAASLYTLGVSSRRHYNTAICARPVGAGRRTDSISRYHHTVLSCSIRRA